jgi:transcriptional regulator with XRE-family HTH domain
MVEDEKHGWRAKIKRWLRLNRLTQTDFANQVGVTQGAVARWMTEGRIPSWRTLRRIAVATDGFITPADFIETDEKEVVEP